MKGKRGLSDIVTNVLIILLVLVAVSIIWFFIRPLIQQGAGSVTGVNDCLTIDIEPVSCSTLAGAVIKRNTNAGGSTSAAVEQLKLVFTNPATKSSEVYTYNTTINELATVPVLGFGGITVSGKELTVAPVIRTTQGQRVCDPSSVKVLCS